VALIWRSAGRNFSSISLDLIRQAEMCRIDPASHCCELISFADLSGAEFGDLLVFQACQMA
jgi:hypothetical protein